MKVCHIIMKVGNLEKAVEECKKEYIPLDCALCDDTALVL